MGHLDNITIRPITGEVVGQGVGTIYQDLPEKGFLSCLMVNLSNVCQLSTNPGLDQWNIYDKFEVLVDGSKVVKSYDAKQLRAIAHYSGMDLSQLGWYGRHDTAESKMFWNYPILFGRYPGDMEYMLDMERYSNPQLRITYNADKTTVDGETYNASADPYIRSGVEGLIMRDGAPKDLKGYIKSTEIDNWSCIASTTRQTEIPRGNNIIGYMQGSRYSDKKMPGWLYHHELTFDNGEWQLYDHSYSRIKALEAMWYPRPVKIRVRKDLGDELPLDLCVGVCNQFGAASFNQLEAQTSLQHEGTWNIQDLSIVSSAPGNLALVASEVYISGQFPHQNCYFPLRHYSEEGEFGIDTTKYGRIDIKTTTDTGINVAQNLQTVAEYVIPTGE
ncbi:hypothetical protein KA005_59305 [bacterium]|nr:hypothetical protein [bacterium]